jgi:hypothetical protein
MEDNGTQGFQLEGHDVGEYTIASAVGVDELIKKVNALIKEKWFPIGGPLAGNTTAGQPLIVQSLIRSRFATMKRVAHA